MSSLRVSNKSSLSPTPVASLIGVAPYRPVDRSDRSKLYLEANEGASFFEDDTNLYPDVFTAQKAIANLVGQSVENVFVGSGGDDVIQRICSAYLDATRQLTVAVPTFSMIPKLASITGAAVVTVEWSGRYPEAEILAASEGRKGVIAIVSPNNPTGETVPFDVVERISKSRPDSVILLDLAYVEFADLDPTEFASRLSNVICVRTFSKAWGSAGIRVGYGVGRPELIAPLLAVGSPYPLTTDSIARVNALVEKRETVERAVTVTKARRSLLTETLACFDVETSNSEANFVYAKGEKSLVLERALRSQGIICRRFENATRIGVPNSDEDFVRLDNAIRQTFEPQALLFDMDGVLVDVSRSYRAAIQETAARFGVVVSQSDIDEEKRTGDANDDWALTFRLIEKFAARFGVSAPPLAEGVSPKGEGEVTFDAVKETFESLYQTELWKNETALISTELLQQLQQKYRLGVVTGRPRADLQRALKQFGWAEIFDVTIAREDAPLKPSPLGVRRALGVSESGWFIGDTKDDIDAGLGANVLAVGIGELVATPFTFDNVTEALSWLR